MPSIPLRSSVRGVGVAAAALVGLVLLVLQASPLAADDGEPVADDDCRREIFPSGHLFQPYLADPGRSGFALAYATFSSTDVEDAGERRAIVRLGGIYGLLGRVCDDRRHPWQVDFSAGFLGHFDGESQLDSIAWDGFYSLMFTWGRSDGWSFRAGLLHDSAHVGDEFAEETGRRRINYTREEVIAAASWSNGRHWRLYGEGAFPYNTGDNDIQEDLRIQVGAEWVGDPMARWSSKPGSSTHWYAALDAEALDTRDFEPRVTVQSGLMLIRDAGDDLYRFGLEATTGPSVLGELILEDETYFALGMWFDI